MRNQRTTTESVNAFGCDLVRSCFLPFLSFWSAFSRKIQLVIYNVGLFIANDKFKLDHKYYRIRVNIC